MYHINNLVKNDVTVEIDGNWVPARPVNYKCQSWIERFKDAWFVFVGKADAIVWEKQ